MDLWRTTQKHTQKKKLQRGALPDLLLAKSLKEVSKARSMKELKQETLQKYSSLLHAYHNTGKICCVGVQSSHLKRAGNAIMSRKDFLHGFLCIEDISKAGKVQADNCVKKSVSNYTVDYIVSFEHAAELMLKIHVFP